MSKTAITSPELAPPVGPFSQAVKIDGFPIFSGHDDTIEIEIEGVGRLCNSVARQRVQIG